VATTDKERLSAVFARFSIAAGWGFGAFAVERVDDDMHEELQLGLDAMLHQGLEGIPMFERLLGSRVIPPN